MDAKLESIEAKLDRILSILDAKCAKQKCDRDRIKSKRDEDAAQEARKRGAIVVERLAGTFHRDDRLPYKKWAFIALEFDSACDFLRWLVNEYLASYFCLQDGRKRMIARNGNYWKTYKSCGSEMLLTPADMFGGAVARWDTMLDVQMLKWCFKHVMPVLGHLVNEERLEYVHDRHLPWDDEKVNAECGEPLPLESRWWRKSARFQETMLACVAPYGRGYVRTSRGSLLIDVDADVLERPETQLLFKGIYTALREGVMNRSSHDEWVSRRRLGANVEHGTNAWMDAVKQDQAVRFMEKLKRENAVRLGMHIAVRAKEEGDLQVAIERSIKEI
jgi:hypothetical protein